MEVKQIVHTKARSPPILEACNRSRGARAIKELAKLKLKNGIMQIQDSTGAKKPKQTRLSMSTQAAQEKEHELQVPLSICCNQNRKVLLNTQAWG